MSINATRISDELYQGPSSEAWYAGHIMSKQTHRIFRQRLPFLKKLVQHENVPCKDKNTIMRNIVQQYIQEYPNSSKELIFKTLDYLVYQLFHT